MAGFLKFRSIVPVETATTPAIARRIVDLPAPEGPIIDTNSCGPTEKLRSLKANWCLGASGNLYDASLISTMFRGSFMIRYSGVLILRAEPTRGGLPQTPREGGEGCPLPTLGDLPTRLRY